MRAHLWILNGKVPEPCLDVLRWARWFETAERHVGNDYLAEGDLRISTVFLGLDHNFGLGGPPILFETMVFGEPNLKVLFDRALVVRDDLEMWRYATWDQAEAGHRNIVEIYRSRIIEAREATARAMVNPGTVQP
jgi:hypothetical protein